MIKTCRAGGTDEKTQWSNLLVCILSEIEYVEDTRTRKLFGAKKIFWGGEDYLVFYETIFLELISTH